MKGKPKTEMTDELIAIIGHITSQIEHDCNLFKSSNKSLTEVKYLRKLRGETGQKLFNLLGVSKNLSKQETEEFKNYWCYIKHYSAVRIHMIEIIEQYSSYNMHKEVIWARKKLHEYDMEFWGWVDNTIKKLNKSKQCKNCKKDIDIKEHNYSLEDYSLEEDKP